MNEHCYIDFNDQLLDHIEHGRNTEAKLMLNQELARAYNGDKTLLHVAARWGNDVIAQELIGLGAEVDRLGSNGNTPLMLATIFQYATTAQILLEAKANIDFINDNGKSVLQVALDLDTVELEIFDVFARKLRTESRNNEDLANRLIAAGCNMYHAATLRDVDLMECMLSRGIDIDSRGLRERTALHAAAELNDLSMAEWSIDHGADIDTYDVDNLSALTISTEQGHKDVVKTLLEHGAEPNCYDSPDRNYAPLHAAFFHLTHGPKYVDCAELLLLHGASVESSKSLLDMFQDVLDRSHNIGKGVKLLISYLAMIDMVRGSSIIKHVSGDVKYRSKLSNFKNYVAMCTHVLKVAAFGNLSLLDLLQSNKYKMRLLARKETFTSWIEKFCYQHKLSEFYSYYYKPLMKKVAEASHAVKLEDEAIIVICDEIFKGNYSQCYTFAKKVIEYLDVPDLQSVVQV